MLEATEAEMSSEDRICHRKIGSHLRSRRYWSAFGDALAGGLLGAGTDGRGGGVEAGGEGVGGRGCAEGVTAVMSHEPVADRTRRTVRGLACARG